MSPQEASRLLQSYAKRFHAGAFATPTVRELTARPHYLSWHEDGGTTVAVTRTLSRVSLRHDWTGTEYTHPPGCRIITHLARTPGAPIPDLTDHDVVYAYREDEELSAGLAAQGRVVVATRISAASEIIAAWGSPGERPERTLPHDKLTCVSVGPAAADRDALAEVASVDQWHDDYPFYSDGSWGAVSLRGFDRDDPSWGVKPSEMSRAWWADHPDAASRVCDWTVLADRMPATVLLVADVFPWATKLERVRLLRMAGRDGRGGKLGRHTDITDKAAGLRDGQVARFHLPLVTDPAVVMHCWELDGRCSDRHLAAGAVWYLDARKPHAVSNPTGVDRIHLVVDVIVDDQVRSHLLSAVGV